MKLFPQSIRWRIQLWYLLLIAAIVATLLVAFYRNQKEIKYQVVDRDLTHPITRLLPRMPRGPEPPRRNRRLPRPDPLDDFEEFDEFDLEGGDGPGPPRRQDRRAEREPRGQSLEEVVEELAGNGIFVIEWGRDGEVRFSSDNTPEELRPIPDEVLEGGDRVSKRTVGDYREVIHSSPSGGFLLLGTSVAPLEAELSSLQTRLTGVGVSIVLGGFLVGWLLIGRSLKPMKEISETAHRIAGGDLSNRIAIKENGSELGQLSAVLNETFEKLESSFEHQVRFTADASHEMRTPIAVILAKSQFALSRERSPEKYQEALQTCMDSAQHMRTLTDGLLELSKVDSGEFDLHKESANLEDLTREVVRLIEPLADECGMTIRCDLQSLKFSFDTQKMRQALLNLLSNAVKYNRKNGEIEVVLKEADGVVHWSVRDTGLGMEEGAMAQVFERFYRVDKARTQGGRNGTGLGLPITKAIIEAHGGSISLESEVDQGTIFRIQLPT